MAALRGCLLAARVSRAAGQAARPAAAAPARRLAEESKQAARRTHESPIQAALAPAEEVPFSALSPAQKVVEGTKTGGSVVVIAGGLALAATFLWATIRELFLADTPDTIRDRAISEVMLNHEVTERLGAAIQPTGQVAIQEYIHGKFTYTRVAFLVFGDQGQARINLEIKKPTAGGSEKYRYFYVDIAEAGLAPSKRVILHDNRGEDATDQQA